MRLKLQYLTVLCGLALAISGCGQTTRQDLLGGKFGTVDSSPPKLIAPADNAIFSRLQGVLIWSRNSVASEYLIDISIDSGFSQPIAGFPRKIKETSLYQTFPEARTYFWRVRHNLSDSYSEVRRVHVLGDAILVHCEQSETDCSNTDRYGNMTFPYRNIQNALNRALELGLEVRVAARGGQAYYRENLNLLPGSVLRGGYEAITWTQDISTHRSEIRSNASRVVQFESTANGGGQAVMEGMTIYSEANALVSYAVYASGAGNLELRRNTVIAVDSGSTAQYGIFTSLASMKILQNTIHGNFNASTASPSYALYIENSSPLVFGNTINGGRSAIGAVTNSYAVYVTNGAPVISENTIYGGVGGSAHGLYVTGSGIPIIRANYIHGGNGGNTYALRLNGASSIIAQNTIDGGDPGNTVGRVSRGVFIESGTQAEIYANLLLHSSGVERFGIYENDAAADPAIIRNNLMVSLSGGGTHYIYADYLGGGSGNCGTGSNWRCMTDANSATALIEWSPSAPDQVGVTGNLAQMASQNIADLFAYAPRAITHSFDGPDAGSTYQGTMSRFEFSSQAACELFVVGEYLEYFFDYTPRQVTARDCSAATSFVDFSPAISYDFGRTVPIVSWGAQSADYLRRFSLKTGTQITDSGFQCPTDFTLKIHVWGTGTNQSDCDKRYPHSAAGYNAGNCVSRHLFPAIEINEAGNLTGNGLCEAGERCLFNPNIGKYAGHGSLIASGCDLSGISGGEFVSINLLVFAQNGY
jgi:hypothetical protein